MSENAWEFTARLSPRPTVRVAVTDDFGHTINSYPPAGITPIETDPPSRPWAIYLTDLGHNYRLLCFDLDGKTPDAARDAANQAVELAQLLDDAGIPAVVCQSGPAGGRHVWAALSEGVDAAEVHRLAELAKCMYSTLDLSPLMNAATGCVRPPGAPHRSGGASTVISGDLTSLTSPIATAAHVAAATERLARLVNAQAAEARTVDFSVDAGRAGDRHSFIPGVKRRLDGAAATALRTEVGEGDASAALWRVLTGAAAAHWEHADVARLVKSAPGLEHVRTQGTGDGGRRRRSPAESAKVLRYQWARAVAYIASGRRPVGTDTTFDDRADAIAGQVRTLQARADAAQGRWARGGGPADRRILDALCVLTLQAISADVEADIRRLALLAGIGRETARTALLRLSEEGWIQRTREAEGPHGAHWKIRPGIDFHRDPDEARSQVAHRPPGAGAAARNALLLTLSERMTTAAHDLFTGGALGLYVGNVYARCTQDFLVLEELSGIAGGDAYETVQALTQLTEAGVLRLSRHGWYKPAVDGRDAAAEAAGTRGALAARAVNYSIERELWAMWCDELEWMNTPRAQRQRRPGLGQLVLVEDLGPVRRPAHPRSADGRADFRAARHYVTGTLPEPPRPRPVPVSDAERLIIDVLGGVPIDTIPLPGAPGHRGSEAPLPLRRGEGQSVVRFS